MNNSKNILCINYEYPPVGGGGGVVCAGLARTLTDLGYNIDIVTSGMKDLPAYEEQNGVNIHRVKCLRLHKHYTTTPELFTTLLPTYKKALELTRQKKYLFNHTHFIVPSSLISYFLWRKTGLPYIITLHGSDVPGYNPDRFSLMHRLIGKPWSKIVRNALILTSPSNFLKNLALEKVNHPIEVIPNGFNFFTSNTGCEEKKNRIIVVTRMFERKGVQYFLRAIAGMKTDWEICIAGDGPYLPQLKEEAEKNASPVKFLGFIQGQELVDLYQKAKIFVFPSIQENFPVVLLEAMNAGCAVITTKTPGCSEVVGDAAIKVEPGRVEPIRESLTELMADEEAIRKYSEMGIKRAAEFSWPNVAKQFDDLFQRLNLDQQE